MRISDWSSDVCSSDLKAPVGRRAFGKMKPRSHAFGGQAPRGGDDRRAGHSQSNAPFFQAYTRPSVSSARKTIIVAQPAQPISSRLTARSEEHTSELQSLMRISYAVFCLKKKKTRTRTRQPADIMTDIHYRI